MGFKKKIGSMAAAGAIVAGSVAGAALLGAAPASAAVCGYSNAGGQAYYNHCGTGLITVRIDRVGWGGEACFGPGTVAVNGSGLARVTNIYYVHQGCN